MCNTASARIATNIPIRIAAGIAVSKVTETCQINCPVLLPRSVNRQYIVAKKDVTYARIASKAIMKNALR